MIDMRQEYIDLVAYMHQNFRTPAWQAVNLYGTYICFSVN